MTNAITMDRDSSELLALLRAVATVVIAIGHVGLFWMNPPWTQFLQFTVPLFFFISGAVSYHAFCRSATVGNYLLKRSVGLLVPFYLIALLALLFYVADHQQLPPWSWEGAWRWLTIALLKAWTPFPLNQVWFLGVLLIICLISPLLFRLQQQRSPLLWLWLLVALLLATLQLWWPLGRQFWLAHHNFYKPIVHSLFFVAGALWLSHASHWSALRHGLAAALFAAAALALVTGLELPVDFAAHTYYPSLYYVIGSLALIALCAALKQPLLWLYRRPRLRPVFAFFFTHTFSVYLTHTFAIYASERWLAMTGDSYDSGWPFVAKSAVVLAATALMAVPFSAASNRLIQATLRLCQPRHGG